MGLQFCDPSLKCYTTVRNGVKYEWCSSGGCAGPRTITGVPPPPTGAAKECFWTTDGFGRDRYCCKVPPNPPMGGGIECEPFIVQPGASPSGAASPSFISTATPAARRGASLSAVPNNRRTTGRTGEQTMSCQPGCGCTPGGGPSVPGPGGSHISVQPRSGTGQNLCWGAAGGEASPTLGGVPGPIGAGATGFITIAVQNYSWLKPRKLTVSANDPALATGLSAGAISAVRVTEVSAVGRQILGSAQGISGQSIAADSQNALTFGRDISPISSSNTIVVQVVNNSAVALRISADVEGEASQ